MRSALLFVLTLFVLSGCTSTPVRHLASDAVLIKPGQTTAKEVQKYLGEPNGRREVAPGVTEYVYHADLPGPFGKLPVVGAMSGPAGYEMIIVTLKNDLVTNCEFRNFNTSDRKWMEDYTWEEVK